MSVALELPEGIVLPAKNYRHVRAACRISNGVQPKDLARLHVDLSDARGLASRVSLIDTDIRGSLGTDFVRCLLTGHTGCGKSTELRWLAHQLSLMDADQHRYHTIFVDADDYANVRSMRLPELLTAIFSAIAEDPTLQKFVALSSKAKRVWDVVVGFLKSLGIELAAEIPVGVAKLKATLKVTPGLQERVAEIGQTHVRAMMDGLTALIEEIRAHLLHKDYGFEDIVLIVDNLERVERTTIASRTDETTHDRFFLDELPRLQALPIHMVLTFPVALLRSIGRVKAAFAQSRPMVLPMVTVHQCGKRVDGRRVPSDSGVQALKRLLARRVDLQTVFANELAIERLIVETGGSLRDLLRVLSQAVLLKPTMQLSVADIDVVLADEAVSSAPMIEGSANFDLFFELSRTGRFPENTSEDLQQRLLSELVVLEYNGDGWFDVNPAVERSRPYRDAQARRREVKDDAAPAR